MLESPAIIALAQTLVAFVNQPVRDSRAIELSFGFGEEVEGVEPLPFTRQSSRHYEALRKEVRWLLTTTGRRVAVADFLGDHLTPASSAYPWTTIFGLVDFADDGQLVMKEPRFQSVEDAIAIVLGELVVPDAPMTILLCGLESCGKFFVRPQGRGAVGRPKRYCSTAHANTHRTQRRRAARRAPRRSR